MQVERLAQHVAELLRAPRADLACEGQYYQAAKPGSCEDLPLLPHRGQRLGAVRRVEDTARVGVERQQRALRVPRARLHLDRLEERQVTQVDTIAVADREHDRC